MRAVRDPYAAGSELPAILLGAFEVSQYFELGDSIDLARAHSSLSRPAIRRAPPPRVRRSESIQIAEPPLRVDLSSTAVELGGARYAGALRATIYDLGAVALTLRLTLPSPATWETAADLFAAAQELPDKVQALFQSALDELEPVILPAITRPARAALVEDYAVLMIERLAPPAGAAVLAGHPLARAALQGERRPLSPHAADLATSMSYYPDDLALLSWNGALVIEPEPLAAETVSDLIEFANVELLLLRSYEEDLGQQLNRLNQRTARARRSVYIPLVGRYNRLLQEAQRLVIEVTEVTERIDNAFKVTDDVYWNRLYSALLGTLRVGVWREGVEHRLRLLRESYSMLHDQADSDRSASLEIIIILLILFEILLALVRRA